MAGQRGPKRRYPRAELGVGAAILSEVSGGRFEISKGWITVLGGGGAFLEGCSSFQVGSYVELRFTLPGTGNQIACRGIVRGRVPEHGIGVEFTELSPSDRELVTISVRSMLVES